MDPGGIARPSVMRTPVVHLHATRRCNLTCTHCYSSSGPSERGSLPLERLLEGLRLLRGEGYEVLSLSGGEPFLVPELGRLVGEATAMGYRVTAVSNGTLLDEARLAPVAGDLRFVAVSVDGRPETHDRLRGRPGALDRARRGMGALRAHGVPFGVAFCVTRSSLGDVPWVHEMAQREGARLLDLRPLAAVGRGSGLTDGEALTETDRLRLRVLAALLDGPPPIHVETTPAALLREPEGEGGRPRRLADLVNPLVIEETGRLVPFAYGIHARFALGALTDAPAAIRGAMDSPERFTDLLARAARALPEDPGTEIDWYAHLVAVSHEAPITVGP